MFKGKLEEEVFHIFCQEGADVEKLPLTLQDRIKKYADEAVQNHNEIVAAARENKRVHGDDDKIELGGGFSIVNKIIETPADLDDSVRCLASYVKDARQDVYAKISFDISSFHISTTSVCPGKTGEEKRTLMACAVKIGDDVIRIAWISSMKFR